MAKQTIALINAVGRVIDNDPIGRRPAQGRLPGELQRHPGRDADPGRRPVRADLAGRQGGLRHRQHEARPERRADHRHPGRRERGDPADLVGERELLPVRADRAGGARSPTSPATSRASYYQTNPELRRALGRDRVRRLLRRRPGARSRRSSTRCCTTTGSWRWPTTRAYIDAQDRVDAAYARPAGLDPQRRPQRRPVRVLLQRPVDPRLPRPDLERRTGGRRLIRGLPSESSESAEVLFPLAANPHFRPRKRRIAASRFGD